MATKAISVNKVSELREMINVYVTWCVSKLGPLRTEQRTVEERSKEQYSIAWYGMV